MVNPPRTREFYRPLLEDIHEAARACRESLSRLHSSQLLLVAVILLVGPVLVISLILYAASIGAPPSEMALAPAAATAPDERVDSTVPATVAAETRVIRSLEERGARFSRLVDGRPTRVVLEGEQFTDRDMLALSTLPTLNAVTISDAPITDDGLRALRLPALQRLTLVNTRVTDEAAEAYAGVNGPPIVNVQWIREFGTD